MTSFDVVTGAFSYSGKALAEGLLAQGRTVRTLTRRVPPPGSPIAALPFNFDNPDELRRSLEGAGTVFNTYWVRFERGRVAFDEAVRNTLILIRAAEQAGVGRFVHVSITKPSLDSQLPYFRGKALIEKGLVESGLPYGIVRPTVIFGRGDVFINNIAWLLRRFPFFAVAGDGAYEIQPVHVDDLARICLEAGAKPENLVWDAAGPERFTFAGLVRAIGEGIGARRPIIRVPPPVFLAASKLIGALVADVVVNKQELDGLMAGLTASDEPPRGKIALTEWLSEHADSVGRRYASEIGRNFDRGDAGTESITAQVAG